ncbi:helix-turn-helix domain-containing protein [Allobaculum stercoricanis]|uniref:helix-turn-helix domain-containing protein n=1 Tax=Allobaculum stercoricanis TaxID=174709 RepID=UPI0003627A5D|nr:XRE family transcriptional regulator [Allobaculum stercoricanis]
MSEITNIGVGTRIKEIRNQQNITLKQLSESTNLSIGFLSQLERGLSNVAIDSLQKIANALQTPIQEILDTRQIDEEDLSPLLRTYDRKITVVNPTLYSCVLSNSVHNLSFLPRECHLQPSGIENFDIQTYSHEGYEWIYVLEGNLRVTIDREQIDLYPGDTITIDSTKLHNWQNCGSKTAKFITINTPNPFKK